MRDRDQIGREVADRVFENYFSADPQMTRTMPFECPAETSCFEAIPFNSLLLSS
jgi:hypothetical protein